MSIYCVVCGNLNPTSRMTTCSTACRSKLSRERRKKMEAVEASQFNLFEQSQLNRLDSVVPAAALLVNKIYQMYGKEPALWAMEAIEIACGYVAGE